MIEVLHTLLSGGLFFTICYLANIISKCIVTVLIIHSDNLSDTKVKCLTQMLSKDIRIRK